MVKSSFLKLFLFVGLMFAVAINSFSQENLRGLTVPCKVTNYVSSKSEITPMVVVANDVTDRSGTIVIFAGTPVQINYNLSRAKGMGKAGFIDITPISTTDVNGKVVFLSGNFHAEGIDKKGTALGCGLGLGLTVLFPFGFFFFCIQGENVEIPNNTIIICVSQ